MSLSKKADDISEFHRDYMETALWSSNDSDGNELDKKYTTADFAEGQEDKAKVDCESFLKQVEASGIELKEHPGHDFWLTRNHHGAGFWDGDYDKETGNRLTQIAQSFGEVSIEVGDDGKLYFFP